MNKIRSGQLFTVLLTCAAFTFLCQSAAFTMEGVFGEGIAAIAQILLCIPIVFLYRGGFSFSAYARRHQLLPLIFIGYLLIRGGVSFVRLQQSSSALSLPISGDLLAAGLIALVCLYTVSLGIHALARSSTLIFGILMFALIIMFIGAIPQAEPQNLSMTPEDSIWQGFLRGMYRADELILFFMLLDFCEKKQFRTAAAIFTGKFALAAYFALLGMAVLGNRMKQSAHPFFSTIAISQPLSTQRADALYLLIFVMLCVIRITLFTVLAAHLLRLSFPKIKYTSTICLGIMLAISAGAAMLSLAGWWHLAALAVLALGIPLCFLLVQKRGGVKA